MIIIIGWWKLNLVLSEHERWLFFTTTSFDPIFCHLLSYLLYFHMIIFISYYYYQYILCGVLMNIIIGSWELNLVLSKHARWLLFIIFRFDPFFVFSALLAMFSHNHFHFLLLTSIDVVWSVDEHYYWSIVT